MQPHHIAWLAIFTGVGAQWVFSAFVGGMPEPDTSSGKGYRWLYGSLHLLAANLKNVNKPVNGDPKS